jgi:hypothetical protein
MVPRSWEKRLVFRDGSRGTAVRVDPCHTAARQLRHLNPHARLDAATQEESSKRDRGLLHGKRRRRFCACSVGAFSARVGAEHQFPRARVAFPTASTLIDPQTSVVVSCVDAGDVFVQCDAAHQLGCGRVGAELGAPGRRRQWRGYGRTTANAERIKALGREVRELRRANAFLKSGSAFFTAELDRPAKMVRFIDEHRDEFESSPSGHTAGGSASTTQRSLGALTSAA